MALVHFPDDRFKLQHLHQAAAADTGRVVNGVLGPAHDLAAVVDARTDRVVASQAGQLCHRAVAPGERDAGIAAGQAEHRA
jgi:hypothetical protein